jgi:hypothetical protein
MKEKELRLSQELMQLQKQFNEMCRVKDQWMGSYHSMRKERDKYLHRCMKAEQYISDRLTEDESFPDLV